MKSLVGPGCALRHTPVAGQGQTGSSTEHIAEGRGCLRGGGSRWRVQPISSPGLGQRLTRCQLHLRSETEQLQEFFQISQREKVLTSGSAAKAAFSNSLCVVFICIFCLFFCGWEAVQSSTVFWDCTVPILFFSPFPTASFLPLEPQSDWVYGLSCWLFNDNIWQMGFFDLRTSM